MSQSFSHDSVYVTNLSIELILIISIQACLGLGSMHLRTLEAEKKEITELSINTYEYII